MSKIQQKHNASSVPDVCVHLLAMPQIRYSRKAETFSHQPQDPWQHQAQGLYSVLLSKYLLNWMTNMRLKKKKNHTHGNRTLLCVMASTVNLWKNNLSWFSMSWLTTFWWELCMMNWSISECKNPQPARLTIWWLFIKCNNPGQAELLEIEELSRIHRKGR